MYKTRLQELCQKKGWELPVYTTGKNGPCHVPRFTASVTVQGQLFETAEEFKSVKDAQNTAARIAFDHFNVASPAAATAVAANCSAPATVDAQIRTGGAPIPVAAPVIPPPELLPLSPLPSSLPNPPAVGLSMYKNQLQQFAQKEDLGFPVYSTEAQGPPHDRRFKSKVCVDGKTYETAEFFPTLKEAEQAVAKVACQALSVDVIQEDGGLYKNLLQEFAQKNGILCPTYETASSGMSHRPVFVSSVILGTDTFRGAEAKTKKLAEMNAAKIAYLALTKGHAVTNSTMESTITECPAADNLSQNAQPSTTTKKYHDTTNEEPDHAKRAKASPENMDEVPPSSHHPGQTSDEQTPENQPAVQQCKTVVYARELNWPIPEHATVLPYSDEKWVAFKVGVDKEAAT